MLIQYDGAHPEIVVDELDVDTVIKAGVPVEVPDELAARLLEQSTWSTASRTGTAPVVVTPVTSVTPVTPDTSDTTESN